MDSSHADTRERLARISSEAERIFGDREFAREWMSLPNPTLRHRIPMQVAETPEGADEVEAALSRFAHGDYI